MVRALTRLLFCAMEMSSKAIGTPLKSQLMLRGRSPFITRHWIDAASPSSKGSSPNEKGCTFGGTKRGREDNDTVLFSSRRQAEVESDPRLKAVSTKFKTCHWRTRRLRKLGHSERNLIISIRKNLLTKPRVQR